MRLFITITFLSLFSCSIEKRELPIYGRSEIKERNDNGIISFDTLNHTIKAFKFYNQDSILVDNNTFNNSIYVADFFFTTCPTICPIMKNNLIKVYNRFLNNERVKYLSHTINPDYDNVLTLKKFSDLTHTLTIIFTELSASSDITTIGSILSNILLSSLIHFNKSDFA